MDILAELLVGSSGLLPQRLADQTIAVEQLSLSRDDMVARGLIHLRALLIDPTQRDKWREAVQQALRDLAADLASSEPQIATQEAIDQAVEAVWSRFVLAGEDLGDVAERHAVWLAHDQLPQGLAYPRSLRTITKPEILQVLQQYLLDVPVIVEVVPIVGRSPEQPNDEQPTDTSGAAEASPATIDAASGAQP